MFNVTKLLSAISILHWSINCDFILQLIHQLPSYKKPEGGYALGTPWEDILTLLMDDCLCPAMGN